MVVILKDLPTYSKLTTSGTKTKRPVSSLSPSKTDYIEMELYKYFWSKVKT